MGEAPMQNQLPDLSLSQSTRTCNVQNTLSSHDAYLDPMDINEGGRHPSSGEHDPLFCDDCIVW